LAGAIVIPLAQPANVSIRETAQRFRARELSPVTLTETMLDRATRLQPALHPFVEIMADEARTAARDAEQELVAGNDRGLLHGIPVAIKDIFDVQGSPTRCGSPSRDNVPAAQVDADAVARLRDAGAIFIGKTVTQEFAAGVISAPARNPWDTTRIPGGSSGGSAVAVAAGSCLAALGSDTGGSIRIPAAATGIVGLKPTYGCISTRGVFPLSWSLDTVGPLARTVDDAAILFSALTIPGGSDRTSATSFADSAAEDLDLRGIRIGVSRPYFFDRLQPDVLKAIDAAVLQLRDLGAAVLETPWRVADSARAVAFLINRIETVAVHERLLLPPHEQLSLINSDLRLRLKAGALVPATYYLRALRARSIIKRSIADLFTTHRLDALVTPTLPASAVDAACPLIHFADGDEPVGTGYTRLTMPFNATGQPALTIPCGFDRDRLPIGIQIVGRPFDEPTICRIGRAYEQSTPWHLAQPPG
jgi:aspartyl-tRNA(Asn)/glutamyl-tRNA(Gln) amidotransferase subunit A